MSNIAINGLGRIGRATLKIAIDHPELDVVAINDLISLENLVYLLRYDSVYGRYARDVRVENGNIRVDDHVIKVVSEKDPAQLPWGQLDVDMVFECTGVFVKEEDLRKHIEAGAKRVILSAPSKSETVTTIVHGVSDRDAGSSDIVSCASCTTNCIAPVVEVLERRIGIEKAVMTTVHAYTSTQGLVDGPAKKMRRGRAGAANLVPTTTGAATATTKVVPHLQNKFDGIAIRVPVPVGSIADVVCVTQRETSVDEVNGIFEEEAQSERYRGVIDVTPDPIVSTDIIGNSHASIVDLNMTQVIDGNLVKILGWYDNEWGYASQMIRHARAMMGTEQVAAAHE